MFLSRRAHRTDSRYVRVEIHVEIPDRSAMRAEQRRARVDARGAGLRRLPTRRDATRRDAEERGRRTRANRRKLRAGFGSLKVARGAERRRGVATPGDLIAPSILVGSPSRSRAGIISGKFQTGSRGLRAPAEAAEKA